MTIDKSPLVSQSGVMARKVMLNAGSREPAGQKTDSPCAGLPTAVNYQGLTPQNTWRTKGPNDAVNLDVFKW